MAAIINFQGAKVESYTKQQQTEKKKKTVKNIFDENARKSTNKKDNFFHFITRLAFLALLS